MFCVSGRAHAFCAGTRGRQALRQTVEHQAWAARPFGGFCALEFLDRFAGIKPAERLLVVGASGGIGAYAVQVAKTLGAKVTGVASAGRGDFVEWLGADLIGRGRLRPVVDRGFPFKAIRDAYAHVEGRHRAGAVVLDLAQ